MMIRPTSDEYPVFFEPYVNLVQNDNLEEQLVSELDAVLALLSSLSEEEALYRYAPDKWSIKEVVSHISDTERIMSYRLLRISRGDRTPLPGFDEKLYIENSDFDSMKFSDILEDFTNVRRATISLLKGISDEALLRRGVVSNNEISARGMAYTMVGHQLHHIKIIKEKYLQAKG